VKGRGADVGADVSKGRTKEHIIALDFFLVCEKTVKKKTERVEKKNITSLKPPPQRAHTPR
jgi:hypothetical protein